MTNIGGADIAEYAEISQLVELSRHHLVEILGGDDAGANATLLELAEGFLEQIGIGIRTPVHDDCISARIDSAAADGGCGVRAVGLRQVFDPRDNFQLRAGALGLVDQPAKLIRCAEYHGVGYQAVNLGETLRFDDDAVAAHGVELLAYRRRDARFIEHHVDIYHDRLFGVKAKPSHQVNVIRPGQGAIVRVALLPGLGEAADPVAVAQGVLFQKLGYPDLRGFHVMLHEVGDRYES